MVIVHFSGGLGNQIGQYAMGRSLAYKLKTELKLDITNLRGTDESLPHSSKQYRLSNFNVQENFATPEEIERVKANGITPSSVSDLKNLHSDIFIQGSWMLNPNLYNDIVPLMYHDFTLKKSLGTTAQRWQEKILAAECAVSLHFRYGDYLYSPNLYKGNHGKYMWSTIMPLDYYYMCMNFLKQRYKNITAFVFSNNLQWVKENLHLDVPTEFVSSGGGLSDNEEFVLMSLCKHNIIPSSTFSRWAAWLNRNPDKKVFYPVASTAENVQQYLNFLKAKQVSPLDFGSWIRVPFDFNKQPDVTLRPYFSLLMVVNNDAATLPETLGTILAQDYKFFELIIIDNASYDDSNKICQQAEKFSDKVTLIKLYDKVSNGAAWNMAFNIAQGDYVMFLKGNDRLVVNALTSSYEAYLNNVINSVIWLREDSNGNIAIAGRKFVMEGDLTFRNLKDKLRKRFDKLTVLKLLSANESFVPIATKIFNRKFLVDNAIKFDEKISDAEAELMFTAEAMLRTDEMLFLPNLFYVAPRK